MIKSIDILLVENILEKVFTFLRPLEAIRLLTSCRTLRHHEDCWNILVVMLGLLEIRGSDIARKYGLHQNRSLCTFSVLSLGFNCIDCYRALDGKDGFFGFTSVCRMCSTNRFKLGHNAYVEASIRFYLLGDQALVSRGYAFLVFPYWLSIDDECGSIMDSTLTAFKYAVNLYEEKVKETQLFSML